MKVGVQRVLVAASIALAIPLTFKTKIAEESIIRKAEVARVELTKPSAEIEKIADMIAKGARDEFDILEKTTKYALENLKFGTQSLLKNEMPKKAEEVRKNGKYDCDECTHWGLSVLEEAFRRLGKKFLGRGALVYLTEDGCASPHYCAAVFLEVPKENGHLVYPKKVEVADLKLRKEKLVLVDFTTGKVGAKHPLIKVLTLEEMIGVYYVNAAITKSYHRDFKTAQELLRIAERFGKNAFYYLGLSNYHLYSNNFGEAKAAAQKMIDAEPKWAGGYYQLGKCYGVLQEFDLAEKFLRMAHKLAPKWESPIVMLKIIRSE